MDKQIREQIEILTQHADRGEINLEFVAHHAMHLSQLAQSLISDNRTIAALNRRHEFMRLIEN